MIKFWFWKNAQGKIWHLLSCAQGKTWHLRYDTYAYIFTTSPEAASSYAKQAVSGFGDPAYTLVQTQVPKSIFEGLSPVTVDGGIPAWVIPNERLQGLIPEILDYIQIP